jgi:hypothetical protein
MDATIYRLTVDNGNTEECNDYTNILDAEAAFMKATRKKGTFSATVYAYDGNTYERVGGRVYNYEK